MIIDEYAKNYAVNIRNRFKSSATHILVANYKSPNLTFNNDLFNNELIAI